MCDQIILELLQHRMVMPRLFHTDADGCGVSGGDGPCLQRLFRPLCVRACFLLRDRFTLALAPR